MSRAVFQPVTQVRLTNVAVVRLSRGGKRFEVACYKNKILNWRNGLETDLSEVLQVEAIFYNVSKGVLANRRDVAKAFGMEDQDEVIRFILEKGTVQVSEKERKAQQEETFRDVATIISDKCVNPDSNRPYTVGVIESALRGLHVSLHPTKAPKAQALELIPRLSKVMPLARAAMKLKIMCSPEYLTEVRGVLKSIGAQSIKDSSDGGLNIAVDPGVFRLLEDRIASVTRGTGRVEVCQMNVNEEGSADIGTEAARRDRERQSRQIAHAEVPSVQAVTKDVIKAVAHNNNEQHRAAVVPGNGGGGCQDQADDVRLSKELVSIAPSKVLTGNRKGKKARREIEAAAERQTRLEAERKRREERAAKVMAAGAPRGGGHSNMNPPEDENVASGSPSERLKRTSSNDNNNLNITMKSKLKCNTCKEMFQSTVSHQEHFKSDYHRENLRRKTRGEPPLNITDWEAADAAGLFLIDADLV